MEDRRVARTKKAIKAVFFEELRKKPLNKITVAEISRKADLGRGTFYLHYKDVFDLNDKLDDEIFNDLEQIFEKNYPTTDDYDLLKLTETITEYIAKNREIFLLRVESDLESRFMKRLKKCFHEKLLQKEYAGDFSRYDEMESLFIVSGVIGVVDEWIEGGLAIPQGEISEILSRLLMGL